jgi:hypothetical protein
MTYISRALDDESGCEGVNLVEVQGGIERLGERTLLEGMA